MEIDEICYAEVLEDPSIFIDNYLIPNKPVLIVGAAEDWICRHQWVKSGELDYDFLRDAFGEEIVPVEHCNQGDYDSAFREEMPLATYLDLLQSGEAESRSLYLKDWHLFKNNPEVTQLGEKQILNRKDYYETPICFKDDWMNWWWDLNGTDDYRFVYLGPAGTFTAVHHDVMCSHSWSANVVGRKRWWLVPPALGPLLLRRAGGGAAGAGEGLPADLRSLVRAPGTPLNEWYDEHRCDPAEFPGAARALARALVLEQGAGDALFVPSGWYHQVENMELTLSINHNWFNGSNIDRIWSFLDAELSAVRRSIDHLKDEMTRDKASSWEQQCEVIMKINSAINITEFYSLLSQKEAQLLHSLGHSDPAQACGYCCVQNMGTSGQTNLKQLTKAFTAVAISSGPEKEQTHLEEISFGLVQPERGASEYKEKSKQQHSPGCVHRVNLEVDHQKVVRLRRAIESHEHAANHLFFDNCYNSCN